MLSPSDADLIRREPALPGLATLLDTEAFVAALRQSLPEAEPGTAQITYIRYKPGMNCLVAYRLEVAGAPVEVYAKTYGPDVEVRLQNARHRSSVPGPLGPGRIVLEAGAIVVSIFPNDDKLKALPRLADATARKRLLRKLIPDRPDLREGTIRCLAYKPERRYVARVLASEDAGVVIRVYTGPGYHTARGPAPVFASRGPLRLARWLGGSDRHHILAFEWLPGRLLSEAMLESELELEAVATVGAALAELHTQNPKGLTVLTREAEAETLLAVTTGLGVVCPHLATRAQNLARRLAAQIVDEPRVNGPIHGDFYAKQVLLAGDAVALLDLDRAVSGDPAADLGNFIAHLERDALRGHLSPNRVEPLRDALLEGYRAATHHLLPARIELYTAAGLLRLAPDPFRHHEPNWPEQIEAILERAGAMADRGWRIADGKNLKSKIQNPKSKIDVIDPLGVTDDLAMPFLAQALDPLEVQRQFERCLTDLAGEKGQVHLNAIRVARHKPGRRCLIEYDVYVERPDAPSEAITLIGKARARGLDESTFRLLKALREAGFGADAEDGICVPEPVGVIPAFRMWLQRKVSGAGAGALLAEPGGQRLARRIAEAIHKLHRTGILPHRRHTMADELRILHERLAIVARETPPWASRLERLLTACDRLGAAVSPSQVRGIHRDFYHDHVLASGSRLYLLDFDLYCAGDPGLDVGNFLGHMTEQSLRATGQADSWRDQEEALEERFVKLAGERVRPSVRAYATLTLVRHIHLSTQLAERRQFTEPLLELCEQRLGVGGRATGRKSASTVVGSLILVVWLLLLLPRLAVSQTLPQPQTRPRRVQVAMALHPAAHTRQIVNETKPDGEPPSTPTESPSPQIGPPPATKSQEVPSTPRPWSFYLVLSSVFDTNINHNEENLQAFGLVAGAGFHYRNHPTRPTFEFNYEVARHAYTATDRWDRTSHNLTASWERKLGRRWETETSGEISLKGSTEDRELADRYVLEQEFQYRLSKRNRLNFGGALRLKRHDDNPGRNAFNPYLEGGFEQRFGGDRKWEISYRYEANRSRNERFKYIRWTYSAEFTTPLLRQGRLTVEAKYRPQKYARLIEIELEDGDDIEIPRRDQRWILGAEWRFPLWRSVELGANYKFETRASNDPDKKFNAHLMGISLTYRW